jgi:drug/metabolite transporter (DMT)-like permease
MTIGGVVWVIMERPARKIKIATVYRTRGIVLAFVASACQAGGLLLSKQGMGHGWLPAEQHLSPQTGTYIRMFFAGLGMIPIFILHRRWERKRRARGLEPARTGSMRVGLLFAACGTIVGPYLGVWMSLVAADRADVGIAQTLCSLPPIFILPFAVWFEKERIGFRAILGALIAVGGSALLFWYP